MMEGAFHQQKRTSPTALTIVLLMHGAGLTALALAKSEVLGPRHEPPIVVDTIPEQKPPPPEPVEKPLLPPDPVVTHTPPIVPMPAPPTPVALQPLPPLPQAVLPQPAQAVELRADPPAPAKAKKVEPARAKANLASYVSDEDYPSNAARNEEQGTTRFRLGVGADGKVTECSVTGSSGSSALDSATCRLMKSRARFTPARDSDGKPTTDSVTSAIRWVLPSD
jgi:protein TonB